MTCGPKVSDKRQVERAGTEEGNINTGQTITDEGDALSAMPAEEVCLSHMNNHGQVSYDVLETLGTSQVHNPGSTLSHWSSLYPICQRDSPRQVGPVSLSFIFSLAYVFTTALSRHVIANDLSPEAIAAMKRNIELNGLAPLSAATGHMQIDSDATSTKPDEDTSHARVRVNEGDAW